jgi:adenine-specific DNA glycosylase
MMPDIVKFIGTTRGWASVRVTTPDKRPFAGPHPQIDDLWAIAERCTPQEQVTIYTQAIMDLGAMVCVRAKPRGGGGCTVMADGAAASRSTWLILAAAALSLRARRRKSAAASRA